jgi:3-deoxy-D-manno-octulosonic-acid transferase
MIYFFYMILSFLSFPFLKGWMGYRSFKGKEDRERIGERYGKSSKKRPKGKVFWFHGASIGECLSFLPVLNYFEKNYPTYSFLITSGTRGSADLLKKKLSKRCIHQYLPLDNPLFVDHFLAHWQPNGCFWTESDFWPNLIIKTSRICPLFLLNGRFSPRSAGRWSILAPLITQVLKSFSTIFPQSFEDFKRFKSLGLSNLKMIGNLKYEGEKLEVSVEEVHRLQKEIRKRPLWVVSNTHAGEEKILLELHKKLQGIIGKNLLLILIPRHKHRWEVIRGLLNDYGLSYLTRTEGKKITESTDVFVVDTLGELGIFYSLSNFVFMAGSLLPGIGGHNVLEPARLGALPIFGPYMENNKDMADLLLKNKAAIQVKNLKQLEKTILHLLKDRESAKKQSHNASEILKNINILQPILNEIKKYLYV